MRSDNISTKYKEETDRLRKECNSAKIDMQKVLRENKESMQNLNTEQVLLRKELQNKERVKSDLLTIFKDQENKDLHKIKRYEKEIENLQSRCRDDKDNIQRLESEYEDLKSRRKDDNDKMQRLHSEIETLKSRYFYLITFPRTCFMHVRKYLHLLNIL